MPKAGKAGSGPAVFKQEISLQPATTQEKPSDEKEKPDFWKMIHNLTPEEWIRHEILLYRRRPKLALQGLGGFVAKFQHPFGIDDVKQVYGGYDWQAFLQKEGHVVKDVEFTIEAAPKPDTKREASAEGLFAGATPTPGTSGVSPDLVSLIGNEMKLMREALQQQMQQQITMLRDELTRERAGPATSPATSAVVDMMKAGGMAAVDLAKSQAAPPTAAPNQTDQIKGIVSLVTQIKDLFAPPDPVADLKRLTDVVEAVNKIRGGEGGHAPAKESLGLALIEKGPEIIERLGAIADRGVEIAKYRHDTAVQLGQRRAAPISSGSPAPTPVAAPGAPLAVGALETIPLGGTAVAASGAPSLEWVKMRVVYMFELGQPGEAIVDFLDGVDERLSTTLKGQTPTEIADFFRKDALLAPAEKTKRFAETVNEMAAYLAPEEEPGGATQ